MRSFLCAALLVAAHGAAWGDDESGWLLRQGDEPIPLRGKEGPALNRWIAQDRSGERRIALFWTELPFPATRIRIRGVGREGPIKNVYERSGCSGDLVLSGGFYGLDGAGNPYPLGWVVADGREITRRAKWSGGGAVVQSREEIRIVGVQALSSSPMPDQALQSKPIVVRDGRNDMRGDDGQRADRAVIGVTEGGALFAALLEDASLFETAQILLLLKKEGAAVKDALALDGGPSAHLYLSQRDLHFGASAPTYVPNVICFEEDRR